MNNAKHKERVDEIVKVGTTAAAASVGLALLEALEGVAAGSVTMIIDGLSHVTEAGTAVVAVIGAKISGRPADKKHPFGYGRIEYLSALIIAILTIYAGITGVIEGVKSILDPGHPHYGVLPLAIVVISMITRIVVGKHDIHVGEHHNSRALLQVGRSELKHSVLSAVTLLSAAVYMLFHIQIGPWIATLISADIIWNGFKMLRDMVQSLLGAEMEVKLMCDIRKTILEIPGVEGVYDLALNNYGPNRHTGSVHLGVADTMSMNELDKLTRKVTAAVKEKQHVFLTGVGIYPTNTKDPVVIEARHRASEAVHQHKEIRQMHGFYMDEEDKEIRFDVEVGFDVQDLKEYAAKIEEEVAGLFPDYNCRIVAEYDYTA